MLAASSCWVTQKHSERGPGLGTVAGTLSFSANICKFLMASYLYEDLRVTVSAFPCPLPHRHSAAQSAAVLRNWQLCLSDSLFSLPLCHWVKGLYGWGVRPVPVCIFLWFRTSQWTSLDPWWNIEAWTVPWWLYSNDYKKPRLENGFWENLNCANVTFRAPWFLLSKASCCCQQSLRDTNP